MAMLYMPDPFLETDLYTWIRSDCRAYAIIRRDQSTSILIYSKASAMKRLQFSSGSTFSEPSQNQPCLDLTACPNPSPSLSDERLPGVETTDRLGYHLVHQILAA